VPTHETPAVYYERLDATAPGIGPVRTDVAGFVGIARRGPVHTAVPVKSWRQFRAYFGEFAGAGYLPYAVRGFFENGGRFCWVVRVASEAAANAETVLQDEGRNDVWKVRASSEGVWGNDLRIRVVETRRAQTVGIPAGSRPEYSVVASVAGFTRATHVRLTQTSPAPPVYKVVSDVDAGGGNRAGESRLVWLHERPEARLPHDSVLTGVDLRQPIRVESVEYTLLVWELGRLAGVYEGLSLVPEHERYGPRVLPPPEALLAGEIGRSRALRSARLLDPDGVSPDNGPQRLPDAPEPVEISLPDGVSVPSGSEIRPLLVNPEATVALVGGADGLALLGVRDFMGEETFPLDSYDEMKRKRRGLRALEAISQVAILSVPDIHIRPRLPAQKAPSQPCVPDPCLPSGPPAPAAPREPAVGDLPPTFADDVIFQLQAAMVEQCERRRDRVALLDPPHSASRDDALGVGAVQAWRGRFDSKYAALYYPWLRVVNPLPGSGELTREVPPSGHVAGQYARTDFESGVHRAPANALVGWASAPTVAVNDPTHGLLNRLGVNVIRALPGRGLRILGARTVSSDPDWRFVNVRRLLIMLEKAIDRSVQWAVFEPNDRITRAKLTLSLTSFLLALWQRGALMGDSPDAAFRVRCDEENNPPAARDNGQLLAEVKVAPSQPFEFVVLRVGRVNNEFRTTEVG
jgi:phage tail sheath protein FI